MISLILSNSSADLGILTTASLSWLKLFFLLWKMWEVLINEIKSNSCQNKYDSQNNRFLFDFRFCIFNQLMNFILYHTYLIFSSIFSYNTFVVYNFENKLLITDWSFLLITLTDFRISFWFQIRFSSVFRFAVLPLHFLSTFRRH